MRATLEENFKLAEAMGMNGTPSYVIGKQVVIGAVGVDNLKEKIGIARCGKATLLTPSKLLPTDNNPAAPQPDFLLTGYWLSPNRGSAAGH